MAKFPIVIGLAGGSCSGKSSISQIIKKKINTNSVTILHEKGYYKNRSQEPVLEDKQDNFDHPNVFNHQLLLNQLKKLIHGQSIREPFYSYKTHRQLKDRTRLKKPAKIIIIEGILVLYDERLRQLMNMKIYVDAASDIMLIRRLRRDVKGDHSNLSSVFNHYINTIRPMLKQFIEPTQQYADVIIPESWRTHIAINLIVTRINNLLHKSKVQE